MNLDVKVDHGNRIPIVKKADTTVIKCSNPSCNKELLSVLHSSSEVFLYYFRVECPKCRRLSFDFDVSGDFRYVPLKDVVLSNVEENEKTKTVILRTIKN